jgi:ribosome production factor 2
LPRTKHSLLADVEVQVGGEQRLEFYANKAGCGLFALGSHTKKRPHNLVLGRFFDGHLYDALELGVEGFKSIQAFGNAGTGAGLGKKVSKLCKHFAHTLAAAGWSQTAHTSLLCPCVQPCILFVGERFESQENMKMARSLLLDIFRGQPVSAVVSLCVVKPPNFADEWMCMWHLLILYSFLNY